MCENAPSFNHRGVYYGTALRQLFHALGFAAGFLSLYELCTFTVNDSTARLQCVDCGRSSISVFVKHGYHVFHGLDRNPTCQEHQAHKMSLAEMMTLIIMMKRWSLRQLKSNKGYTWHHLRMKIQKTRFNWLLLLLLLEKHVIRLGVADTSTAASNEVLPATFELALTGHRSEFKNKMDVSLGLLNYYLSHCNIINISRRTGRMMRELINCWDTLLRRDDKMLPEVGVLFPM